MMTLHVISDLRRDLSRFQAKVQLGNLTHEEAVKWFARLNERADELEVYLDAAEVGEQLQLTDLGRQFIQPGRRTSRTRHLTVVDGARS